MLKKLSVLLLTVSLFLGGCAAARFEDTYVPHNYLVKNYYPEMKIEKKEKARMVRGDKNIKFYVIVKDDRKDKAVYEKPLNGVSFILSLIKVGKTDFAHPAQEMRFVVEKALRDTGWGVVDNKSKADMVLNMSVKEMDFYPGFFSFRIGIKYNDNVTNRFDDKLIYKNELDDAFASSFVIADPSGKYQFTTGKSLVQFYKCLVKEFSSDKFVKAVKQGYGEEMFSSQ